MSDQKGADKPDQITFRFEKDQHYRIVPVNGVWGGPTPRGDIRVEFFHEGQATPNIVTNTVAPGGVVGEIVNREPRESVFTRTLMVAMMLTPDQAESIGQWLQEKAKVVRAVRKTVDTAEKDAEHDAVSRTH